MWNVDISNYKMIYKEHVYNCVSVSPSFEDRDKYNQPKFLAVCAIDEDGVFKVFNDETWCFQFVPRVTK